MMKNLADESLNIPFNRPHTTGDEFGFLQQAIGSRNLSGDGQFTDRCHDWLRRQLGAPGVFLTNSCTAALEMSALLLEVGPGDEIVLPSFTFVSTANAFVLRGATPVFVDIREDTLGVDGDLIEEAVNHRTRAVCVVHYAGIGCEMDRVMALAEAHGLIVIEDDAQGILATHRGRPLGSIGQLAALSFHETKNIIAGEGGALVVNDERFLERAEIIWEKGTNRRAFIRGSTEKYHWVDVGSSFLASELTAAFLWAQLQKAAEITAERIRIWTRYHEGFSESEARGFLRRPVVPAHCTHNAHMYYILLPYQGVRDRVVHHLRTHGIQAVSHYVPLHSSPAGRRFGRTQGSLPVTDAVAHRLLRLPMWIGLTDAQVERVVRAVVAAL